MSETRTIYDADGWRVVVTMKKDEDARPQHYDCFTRDDIKAWRNDEWWFVEMWAGVWFHGVQIGEGTLAGTAHGELGGRDVDAWELVPAEYGETADGRPTVVMPSSLSGVVLEAIGETENWFKQALGQDLTSEDFAKLVRHFDPNGKEAA